jgi:hypothetical protein
MVDGPGQSGLQAFFIPQGKVSSSAGGRTQARDDVVGHKTGSKAVCIWVRFPPEIRPEAFVGQISVFYCTRSLRRAPSSFVPSFILERISRKQVAVKTC